VRGLVLGMADQPAQVLAVGLRVEPEEAFQGLVALADQAIAPALEGMEAFVVLAGRAVDLFEQDVDGVQVLVAQQLADELDVAFACGMRSVPRRFFQRLAQGVGERQAGEHVGLEGGQAFAEFLQCMQLALDLGFALLLGEVVVKFSHGGVRAKWPP
jgi:hypothetical protein